MIWFWWHTTYESRAQCVLKNRSCDFQKWHWQNLYFLFSIFFFAQWKGALFRPCAQLWNQLTKTAAANACQYFPKSQDMGAIVAYRIDILEFFGRGKLPLYSIQRPLFAYSYSYVCILIYTICNEVIMTFLICKTWLMKKEIYLEMHCIKNTIGGFPNSCYTRSKV